MSNNKSISSVNNYIENKIIKNIPVFNKKYPDISGDELELEKLEDEINIINNSSKYYSENQPKNYGNLWTDDERNIIIKCLKKNDFSGVNKSNLYDESVIQKIAKKTERSIVGIKEEIKKMIFKDYIWEFYTYSKLSVKYNIPEQNIKILIKLYLEKYGDKILSPLEIENKILKYQVENIKLKYELKELLKKTNSID
jgi:NADPH-dependent 7-cyano-7-deazaguanine reductase QueF-like protein